MRLFPVPKVAKMKQLEHPAITRTLATGYPEPYKPLLCDTCKDVIQPGEYYGECDGRLICSDCIEDEWKELTAKEKFERLGYNTKFNG
jgi:hypothetical protein